ncbi:MAG TPA: hypothetical protein DEQ34_08175 [Balneolaceae bacterium]|nr:hypothetical protein [Balneolaceae bacterium]|tara:strand:- start:177911 stop:178465 length:555 start_codon:yes stop_codon:yes gene_type:complete
MKSLLKISSVLLLLIFLSPGTANAQERGKGDRPSPNATVSQDIGSTTVTVTYGRPGLKNRALATLAPEGQIWRTGANEATTITFSDDVKFGGKEVAAGTYTLFTIPGENWTFILNDELMVDGRPAWGAYGYKEARDVIRVPAAVTVNDAPEMERFTIYFDTLSDTKAHLVLHWGSTMTAIPITK